LQNPTAQVRVEAHLARMLAFDFGRIVKEWHYGRAVQGRYW